MLSEAETAPCVTTLASRTNSTLPRQSLTISRLVIRGYVERVPCPEDKRATNAHLTDAGWDLVRTSAPGHVATVDALVIDPLSATQVRQLRDITTAILSRLDPEKRFAKGS
jgi:DNA-binding MarR family transcriptional regulator